MVEITGISSRRIGLALGAAFIVLAFVPKALAVILAIPGPVITSFVGVTMATIFIIGMRVIIQDGIDYRKGLIAGVSFWIGVGFQNEAIFPEHVSAFAGTLLKNGMLTGGIAAIVMTMFVELTKPRRHRIRGGVRSLRPARNPGVHRCIRVAKRLGCADGGPPRCRLRRDAADAPARGRARCGHGRRLLLTARSEDGGAVLEFVASKGDENIQDRIALLGEASAGAMIEREVSLRLLRHLASSVRHQQYHDTDIVTVRVEPPGARIARGI